MSNCKIEFYFRAADLAKLIKENKRSKGIIISQEIVQKNGPRGSRANVVYITARPSDPMPAKTKLPGKMRDGDGGDEDIFGCPYPPGCTDDGL
jgi:hypothetical protein